MLNPAFIAARRTYANLLKYVKSLSFLNWHERCIGLTRNAAWESWRFRKVVLPGRAELQSDLREQVRWQIIFSSLCPGRQRCVANSRLFPTTSPTSARPAT